MVTKDTSESNVTPFHGIRSSEEVELPVLDFKSEIPFDPIGVVKLIQRWFNSLRPSDAYMRRQSNHHWFR